MLVNGKNGPYHRCSCCSSKNERRRIKHGMKQVENQQWISDLTDELNESDDCDFLDSRHIYEGERCIFCNSNMYDDAIYGDDGCIEREEVFIYTTET